MAHGDALGTFAGGWSDTGRRVALAHQVLVLARWAFPPEHRLELVLASDIAAARAGQARVVISGPDRRQRSGRATPSPMVARLTGRPAGAVLGTLVSVATVVVIVGVTVVLFFNPVWIDIAQGRARVPAIIGYAPEQVRTATGAILADLILGPPDFAVAIDGEALLGPTERTHMVDVRSVVLPLAWLLALVTVALAAALVALRRRAWVWRAVARGSTALVIVAVVVGVAVVFFFDAAFLLFHRVFFPQGNFTFDPRTQRLVQLFPEQFWTETAIGMAAVGLVLAIVVTLLARRRAAQLGG